MRARGGSSRRWLLALTLVAACHGQRTATDGARAVEPKALLADLRARAGSPLGAEPARTLDLGPAGVTPRLAPSERVRARTLLPVRAATAAHVEDTASGAAVEATIRELGEVSATIVDGFAVYPRAHVTGATVLRRADGDGLEDLLSFESRPRSASIAYDVTISSSIAGLRLVAGNLEMLDAGGVPRLRVERPSIVGADGARADAALAIEGCAVDRSPAAPWGRAVTPPGAARCTLRVSWDDEAVTYPAVLDPRWTATGTMTTARQDHTATLLSTGKVLVAGGRSGSGSTTGLATAELYDPATNTWAATGSMTGGRWSASATQLGTSSNSTTSGKVLIAGGITGTASVATAQLYSPSAGTWTAAASLNAARHLHTATLMPNGNVLVAGGMNGTTVLATAAIYNPSSGTGAWTAVSTNMASARRAHTAVLLTSSNTNFNNKVLIAGGNSGGTTSLTSVQLFDTSALTWSTTTALPSAREGHTATTLANGNVLVTGGKTGTTTLATTLVFTIPGSGTSATWPSGGTMTVARSLHTATLLGSAILNPGSVLVAGGSNGTAALATAETWNGTTWSATTALSAAIQAQTATLLPSGTVLIAGGSSNGTAAVNAGAVYDPSFALGCSSAGQCATGFCVNGVCCDTACTGGCGACNLAGKVGTCSPVGNGMACPDDGNPCTTDTCNGTSTTCQHPAGNNGTACPDDGNPCTTDRCNGTSTTCQHAAGNAGVTCRAAAGSCDVAETCTGTSTTCPTDAFLPSTTVCRASAGVCDAAETCTGTSAACPTDAFLPSTTVCRVAAGECDLAETCTGTGASCPADAKKASGTTCTDDGNVCTKDQCDGTNTACQHPAGNPGTVCRAAAGECDLAETCTGTSTACPTDAKKPSGTACTDDGNVCTKDQCDGTSTACQHPAGNPGTVCRAAAGECDLAEACTGTSTSCPTDAMKPSGSACTDDGNACTTDLCNGTAAICQHAAGNAGAVCRPATGACDLAETCSGTSTACPADGFQPNGTACNDNNACTQTDTCQNGVCSGSNPIVCAGDQCHAAGTCDQATGHCTNPRLADGTACDDGNRCTSGDVCGAGTCLPGSTNACTAPGAAKFAVVIDLGADQGMSYATGINNNGVVVGTDVPVAAGVYERGFPGSRAYTWSQSQGMVHLPWSGAASYANSINDTGVMSVAAGIAQGALSPCRYDPAADTQPVCQSSSGFSTGINAAGTVTGWISQSGLKMFRLDAGSIEILPSATDAQGTWIDADGSVVGASSAGAVRWTAARGTEVLADLVPAGSDWSFVNPAFIRSGVIGGWGVHGGHERAFRITTNATGDVVDVTTLPVPTTFPSDTPNLMAADASNGVEIVGTIWDSAATFPQAAFVYTDTIGAVDLNTLIDPQSGWTLLSAWAINDHHEVVGFGLRNGVNRGYKLTLPDLSACPVPTDVCHVQGTRDLPTGQCTNPIALDQTAGPPWSSKAPLGTPRYAPAGLAFGGLSYVFGGCYAPPCGNTNTATVEAYDPSQNAWSPRAPMPTARQTAAAAAINGTIYVVGGDGGATFLGNATVEAYDPAHDSWTTKASMSVGRSAPAIGAIGGKVYVSGGHCCNDKGAIPPDFVDSYDPATDTWTARGPVPTQRAYPASGVIGSKLYVAGGLAPDRTLLDSLEAYDPATDSWTSLKRMPSALEGPSAAVVDGKLYVIGGSTASSNSASAIFNQVYIYDPAADTWSAGPTMTTARYGAAATVNGQTIFVSGGYATAPINVVEALSPLRGPSCDDGNACTTGDTCQAGSCEGAPVPTCTAPCTGQPDGTSCDDGNACTTGDACHGGTCRGTPVPACTAPCAGQLDGTVCDDGNACTTGDACHGGTCKGVPNPTCTAPCVGQPDGTLCDDGNACTTGEACHAGVCGGGTIKTCVGAATACQLAAACDPSSGACVNPPAPDGTPCNDGNACTHGDSCQLGACVGGPPVVCVASDVCHAPGTCQPATGVCTNPPLPAGTCQLGDQFDYDKAGRLVRDRGALLGYDAYDQLRTVAPAPAPGPALMGPVRIEAVGSIGATQSFDRGGINQQGRVAGYAVMPSGGFHGFVTTGPGAATDINVAANIPGDLLAYGINDLGTVTGTFTDAGGATHPFRYNPATGLEDLGVASNASVYDINDKNQLAGLKGLPDGSTQGFRYTDGIGYEEIGVLPGGSTSYAWTVDRNGTVFGSSKVAGTPATGFDQFGRAVMFVDANIGLQDLNSFVDPTSGLTLVTPNRVSGDWVAGTGDVGGRNVGFRLNLTTGALDTIEGPWAGNLFGFWVNSYGEAVGDGYIDAANTQRGLWFFSDQFGFVNLTELVDPALGWDLLYAAGINDFGDITGWGYLNGVATAYILHLPLRQAAGGAPMFAEAHTYGYDGLRTSTTTAPATPGANVQVWFTQDYTEHGGVREHYVRIGNRIVAKVTLSPPPAPPTGMGVVRESRSGPTDNGNLVTQALLVLLFGGGLATTLVGFFGKKRRPVWGAATAGPLMLLFVASCEMLGTNRRSAQTAWERLSTVYFHHAIGAGPVLTTNADASLREERRSEPFGQPIDADVGGTIGPIDFRREQQNSLGQMTDPNTRWSYHGARWMQPQTARWTVPDPLDKGPIAASLGAPWELNPYSYALQSPTQYWDPDGALAWLIPDQSGQNGPMGRWTTEVRLQVQQGDTRESVARQLLVSPDRIAVENTESYANKVELKPGDTITVLGPPANLRVASNALSHVGSTDFKAVACTYHCNTEVITALKESGVRSPGWTAGQFGDPRNYNLGLPKLQADVGSTGVRLGPSAPGEIDAWKLQTAHATGHVVTNLGAGIDVIDDREGFRYYHSDDDGLVVNPGSEDVTIQPLDDKINQRNADPTLSRLPTDPDQ